MSNQYNQHSFTNTNKIQDAIDEAHEIKVRAEQKRAADEDFEMDLLDIKSMILTKPVDDVGAKIIFIPQIRFTHADYDEIYKTNVFTSSPSQLTKLFQYDFDAVARRVVVDF